MLLQRYRRDPRVTGDRAPDPQVLASLKRMDPLLEVEWFNHGRTPGEGPHFRVFRRIGDVVFDVVRTERFDYKTIHEIRAMDRWQDINPHDRMGVMRKLTQEWKSDKDSRERSTADRKRTAMDDAIDACARAASSGIHSDWRRGL